MPLTRRAQLAVERQRSGEHGKGVGPFSWVNKWAMRKHYNRLRGHLPALADTVIYTARHTTASGLVIRGVDLSRVQVFMGHKSIQTTLRYAHLAPKHLDD